MALAILAASFGSSLVKEISMSLVLRTSREFKCFLRMANELVRCEFPPPAFFLPHSDIQIQRVDDFAQNRLRLDDFKFGLDEVWIIPHPARFYLNPVTSGFISILAVA